MECFYHLTEQTDRETSVALGYFDGVHLGHQAVIRQSQHHLSLLPAVFTFSTKTSHPVSKPVHARLMSLKMKERVLADMGIQLMVCPDFEEFRGMSPVRFVEEILHKRLHAKLLCCGYNFHFGKNASGNTSDLIELGARYGIDVQVVEPLTLGGTPVSSSRIRQEIKKGNMKGARELLGRPFTIDFQVVKGRQLGRTIQAPTINQILPSDFILPRFGVYASTAKVNGAWKPAITNVGVKPTVGSNVPLAETYIFDFEGDLYGQYINVCLYEFIRPEKKFGSIDALKNGIQQDVESSRRILAQQNNN